MKKVLFLIPNLGHGGAEKVLVNLVNHLSHQNFDVTLQTLFDEGVNKKFLASTVHYRSAMKHQFRGNSILLSMVPAKILYKLIVKEEYDIVVSFLEGPTAHIVSGCRSQNTKKVAWIHTEMNNVKVFTQGFISRNQAKRAYLSMDRIACVSQKAKAAFGKISGVETSRISIIYNVNDTNDIITKVKEPISEGCFDKNELNVISVGKLQYVKGYDRLASVHKRLIDDGIKHNVFLLGVGEEREAIENYVKEQKLEHSFHFLGYQENPYKYMAAADIFVCSSRREGFSTAISEALIIGIPVVSTDCSGVAEQLGQNCEFGMIVDNSSKGIYQGLKQLLTDEKSRTHYAEKSAKRGESFSTTKTVQSVVDMLESL